MKKIVKFALRTIAVLLVPAIFTGVSVFAVSQPFWIGLIVLLSSVAIQIILAKQFSEQFAWSEYDDLDFSSERYLLFDRMSARLNLLMNLVKVGTSGAIFYLLLQNFETNPFGRTGWVVTLSLSAIALIIFMIKRTDGAYIKLRLVMSLVVAISLVVGSYLYFGTQAIWLIVLLSIAFGIMNGFRELGDIVSDDIPAMFSILLSLTLTLVALVSTIYQFWYAISDFSYYLFVGNTIDFTLWLQVIGIIAAVGVILLLVMSYKRWQEKKANLARRQLEEAAEQTRLTERLAERNRLAAEQEARDKARDLELLNIDRVLGEGKEITVDQLIYLSRNISHYRGTLPIALLVKVEWNDYFVISHVKKQITWNNHLADVISFFNFLYGKSYTDKELRAIIRLMGNLYRFVERYNEFKGYRAFDDMVATTAQDVPGNWYKAKK